MKPMRILLVDDHTLFRRALASLLASRADIEVVAEAEDGLEAVARARDAAPDVVLMDIGLPGCSGLEATRRIKEEMPEVKVIMLTVSPDSRDLFAAIKSGADGYLLKNLEPYQLFDMLDGVRRGEAALSGLLAARMLATYAKASRSSPEPMERVDELTSREIEVLEQLATGASNREIAEALFVTEHTVKLHVRSILDKLHARNRVQAVVEGVRRGLVKVAAEYH